MHPLKLSRDLAERSISQDFGHVPCPVLAHPTSVELTMLPVGVVLSEVP